MSKLRIILVEDEPLISVYFAELLEDMGNDVVAIETTESGAVLSAARLKPDLLIVDVYLREGNGISAISQILHAGFVPHIFTTGDRQVRGEISPGAIILQKPFLDTELDKAIAAAMLATVPSVGDISHECFSFKLPIKPEHI